MCDKGEGGSSDGKRAAESNGVDDAAAAEHRRSGSGSSSSSSSSSTAATPTATVQTRRARRGPQQSVCLPCRKSKERCDLQWPCVHCRRRRKTCVYAQPTLPADDDDDDGDYGRIETSQQRRRSTLTQQGSMPAARRQSFGIVALQQPSVSPWSEQPGWRDHLFSLLPGDRVRVQRTLVGLFRSIPALIYREHFFHLVHMDAPINAIILPTPPSDVHPALVYALTAYGLRMLHRPPSHDRPSLIPRESVPVPADPNDVALRIQREAEVMLAQSLADARVGVEQSLALGQAAAMLIKLQPELSSSYRFYYSLAQSLAASPDFCTYADRTADLPFCTTPPETNAAPDGTRLPQRSSIRVEEAARFRMVALWAGMNNGLKYPNLELGAGHFWQEHVETASIYMPFVGEQDGAGGTEKKTTAIRYDLGAEDASGFLLSVTSRLQMFRLLSRCGSVWQVSKTDYVAPEGEFAELLSMIDWYEAANATMQRVLQASSSAQQGPVPLPASKQRYAKRVIACAHLQGFLIRRIGIAHNRALQPAVQRAMRNAAAVDGHGNSDDDGGASSAWQIDFASPTLSSWVEVMGEFMRELDEDWVLATEEKDAVAPQPTISPFSLDCVVLYAAASEQYGHGVANVYRLLQHPHPERQSLASALFAAAQQLREKVQRHRALYGR